MPLEFTVRLNGTSENHWHRMGLTQNPFPQIAKAELMHGMMQINSLDGDPITGPADIRARLKGFTEEFIQLCISQFKPGEQVEFDVCFDNESTP